MVTPMIKYTFLIHHADKQSFIDRLGGVGVVDVVINTIEQTDVQKQMIADINNCKQTLEKLKTFKPVSKNVIIDEKGYMLLDDYSDNNAVNAILDNYTKTSARIDQIKTLITKADKECDELSLWGDFSVEDIAVLRDSAVEISFFISSKKQYKKEWEDTYNIVVIEEDSNNIYFIVVTVDGEIIPTLSGATYIKTPHADIRQKEAEIDELKKELLSLEQTIEKCASGVDILKNNIKYLTDGLSESLVFSNVVSVADDAVNIIEGWAPEDKQSDVDNMADIEDGVISVKTIPSLEDNPPILLKNNKFARLYEVISNLYDRPSYHSVDLTPFFAPFFVFFVGICFGDLGYGIITFIAAFIFNIRSKNSSAKALSSMIMWCAFAAIVMGSITGSFFGMSLQKVPWLQHVKFMQQMDMFSFSLMVGIVQILYAMFVKLFFRIKHLGLKYGLSTLGWILTIITTGLTFVLPEKGIDFTMNSTSYIIIISISLLLNVLYVNPEKKNLLSNVGSGLWELYNSITGLLGDTLSYIRLFALGLSSGIIASVFNDLAIGMSGDTPVLKYVIMILILLAGHAINLFMSAISSFVHPLRLTFVEFYKNAGFEGGGREYKPFKKDKK